ncbi:MAG: GNAT family N-acetyltransferase [Mesorhizobium sp.]|nr:GNAT family N-acetyltransferase [Mesorhizobium sp.]
MIAEALPSPSGDMRAALAGADLPVDDLDDSPGVFFRFVVNGKTIGFGGYERYGDNALLRSIVVLPHARRKAAGKAITEALLVRLAGDGVRQVYLLTTSAAGFFQRLGFVKTERATAPAEILASRQAASLCPSSASLLVRQTNGASHD